MNSERTEWLTLCYKLDFYTWGRDNNLKMKGLSFSRVYYFKEPKSKFEVSQAEYAYHTEETGTRTEKNCSFLPLQSC